MSEQGEQTAKAMLRRRETEETNHVASRIRFVRAARIGFVPGLNALANPIHHMSTLTDRLPSLGSLAISIPLIFHPHQME